MGTLSFKPGFQYFKLGLGVYIKLKPLAFLTRSVSLKLHYASCSRLMLLPTIYVLDRNTKK